jgi:hypothetical protein
MMPFLLQNGQREKSCPDPKKKRFCVLPEISFWVSLRLKPLKGHGQMNDRAQNSPGASLRPVAVNR